MPFPDGMFIAGKENILKSLAAQPWTSFQVEEPRIISLLASVGVLVYTVIAQREGVTPYVALGNSTYVLSKGLWKLAFHQQTPV